MGNRLIPSAGFLNVARPQLTTVEIHSKAGNRESVKRQIDRLTADFKPRDHVVAFCTHEALLDNNFAAFTGWHARIDEPPNSIQTGSISLMAGRAAFEQEFNLTTYPDSEWSIIETKDEECNWKAVSQDAVWTNLSDFRKLTARRNSVHIKASSWDEIASGAPVTWFSFWSPLQLDNLASVKIAGAAMMQSICAKVLRSIESKVELIPSTLKVARTLHPEIMIHYFTASHAGSTTFWATSEGRRCLVKVERWLNRYAKNLGFWSGNEVVRHSVEHRISGNMILPKVAGQNCHRNKTSCAFIYSSKPLPQDNVLKDSFDLTDADILAAREDEDILQFIFRGAVRNPDFGDQYDIYLYSKDQAERLSARLKASGFFNVELNGVDEAGIMDFKRHTKNTKSQKSIQSATEKDEQKRKVSRESSRRYRAKHKRKCNDLY